MLETPQLNSSSVPADVSAIASGADALPAAIIDSLDQAMALFDADHCLLHANHLYLDLLRYPMDLRKRGSSLADCLYHEAHMDGHAADCTEFHDGCALEIVARGDRPIVVYKTADGCAVSVKTTALPDGGLLRVAAVLKGLDADRAIAVAESSTLRSSIGSGLEMIEALDAMADGFAYFDAQDCLALFNSKYRDFYQPIADKVVIGARFEDVIMAALETGAIVPQNRTAEEYRLWRIEQRRQPTLQFETKLASGQWLHISERRTQSGGIVSVQSEITTLKERETALRALSQQLGQQNLLFDAALNNMVQGLCMFDADQKLIVLNKRYLDLYNFSPQVVKPGISLREIMEYSVAIGNYAADEADRALAERPTQALMRQQNVTLQRLKDGRVIAVMHSPLPSGGSVATYEDVTARERFEQTLRQYASRLENSNRELQDFAFVASHDLQEPLRKIESFGNRLVAKYKDQLGEEGQLYLSRMQNAASRMRGLINDLLSYSRITSKAQPFQPLELESILREVISDLQVAIEEADAKIVFAALPIIHADPTQMRQLFQNLISNSLKFRKKDQPSIININANICQKTIGLEDPQEYCEIRLSDNGIGFENKYADRIFAIFQRLHGKGEYEGTGIGLATVRKIVERHGGTIKAEGVPGVGATFTIEVPTKPDETKEQEEPA
jgi:signal transduction histidine kinase